MRCDRDGCGRIAEKRLSAMLPGWRLPEYLSLCATHAADLLSFPVVDGVVVLPGARLPPPPRIPRVDIPPPPPKRSPLRATSPRRQGETIARCIVRILAEYDGEMTAHELHRRTQCRRVYMHLRRLVRRGLVKKRGSLPAWYRAAGVTVTSNRRRCGGARKGEQ